ncbi:MAG TPA: metallophosphoesterase, partial [Gammaproteobacteria bacterium]
MKKSSSQSPGQLPGISDLRPATGTITRRTFLHRSLMLGAAGAASGFLPVLNTISLAFAAEEEFSFAWVSDTHLYPRSVNTRFVDKAVRAFKEVQAMSPAPDFMVFGGDLAQLGDPVELRLGAELLNEVKIRKVYIPG